ncbi:PilN domain-containing protein [Desulfuromonas acetoxidans]|uniref:PilN domain-containing protein n=1 Tax=Desulfuromonas acetoxidans TaxID=891 RepID=UPI0029312881|nr:PilN domain-containing protein [Desulfuromonas acetoxidans]
MQQINLYQDQFKPQRRSQLGTILTTAFVAMIVVMVLLNWWQGRQRDQWQQRQAAERQRQNSLQADLTALGDKVATLQPSALLAQKLIETRHQLDLRKPVLHQVERLSAKKELVIDSLEALALQPLPSAWLTTVEFADGGDEMMLSGVALQAERLPQLVEELAQQPVFSGRHFAFARLERQSSGGYSFDLSTRQGGENE